MILVQYLLVLLPFSTSLVPLLVSLLLTAFVYLIFGLPGMPKRLRMLMAALALTCSLADWALFALLPRLGLSYGPVEASWLLTTSLRLLLLLVTALVFRMAARRRGGLKAKNLAVAVGILWLVNLAALPFAYYAMYVEPFDLRVTTVPVEAPTIPGERPLRILHLSDIHVERITQRERELLQQVETLRPDLILMTGDYINIDYKFDASAQEATRQVLSQLNAPLGVYAVLGTADVDEPEVAEIVLPSLENITVLDNETFSLNWQGSPIMLIGMQVDHQDDLAVRLANLAETIPSEAYTILLYHEPSPKMIKAASRAGIDLYLAGHTHGGQMRLPLLGTPMVFYPGYPKDSDRGRYQFGDTTLYVSSGVGMEGLYMPRFRFGVPPEMVLLELGGEK